MSASLLCSGASARDGYKEEEGINFGYCLSVVMCLFGCTGENHTSSRMCLLRMEE